MQHTHSHSYADEINHFRAEKDRAFKISPQSPLSNEQRATFSGIAYYPPSEDHIFELEVLPVADTSIFAMDTSTGSTQRYRRWGKVRFTIEGQEVELTIYASYGSDDDELFLPFRDQTSGSETYGAGRYLDLSTPGGSSTIRVDFNQAYNPYCAYNEQWSCPLPPLENWVNVAIRAGEKVFA